MEKCEVNANDIKKLEKRVTKLEELREKDKSELHTLDTSLQVFISEMKNISDDLKGVVSNFKEAIIRSTNSMEKEIIDLKDKNEKLEKKVEVLDVKIEQETVIANAEKWKKIVSYVCTAIVGAIITFLLTKIGIN